jgi:Protein of unknown function (DUF1553)/Protein of unknown function (DUF1549)/Planctomycete cytochrome C
MNREAFNTDKRSCKNVLALRMSSVTRFLIRFALMAAPLNVTAQPQDTREFFEKRIRPVLAAQCFSCHTQSKMGGLQMDSLQGLLKGGKSGPAILPGKPEDSLLIRAITHVDPNLKMPLGSKLKEQEISDLTSWVKMGAPWPESAKMSQLTKTVGEFIVLPEQRAFWSFQPIRKPALPEVKEKDWVKTPIDRFVLAQLEARGMKPAGAAAKRTLIRRASFDLTGLPPTPEQVEAFLNDSSPNAFSEVVDRLLASPHYGERWGRYWLDVARYGEDDPRGLSQEKYPNAFRYRDWVIQAFNKDMPYDLFVKAQIAGDLLGGEKEREELLAGTGFFGLGPWYYDITVPLQARADERHDRVDVLTRGFLGLTVGCARCHDHKFDPVSMRDYYALAGVFSSSSYREYPLASEEVVKAYDEQEKRIKAQEAAIQQFVQDQSSQLGSILARKTARYMVASWLVLEKERAAQPAPRFEGTTRASQLESPGVSGKDRAEIGRSESSVTAAAEVGPNVRSVAEQENLDPEVLGRWVRYLGNPEKDHPYLKSWNERIRDGASLDTIRKVADEFQAIVLSILEEKKSIDARNRVILEQNKPRKNAAMSFLPNGFFTYEEFCPGCSISVEALERDKYVVWSDLFAKQVDGNDPTQREAGVLLFQDEKLERFLGEEWKTHWQSLRAELERLKKGLAERYPYLHTLTESNRTGNLQIHLRGSPFSLGDEVPRRFLTVLSDGEPVAFRQGSGRLELAEAVVAHPLAARVMVNRVWMHHFGQGIVATPSNFGRLGQRPTHPELLEYLASRLIENQWSIKTLHREIMMSAVYQLGSETTEQNRAIDPDNRWLWRANRRRLDAEALRDSLLFVSGNLDLAVGGPSSDLSTENRRRTVYGRVSRFRLDSTLALFDFPNPSITSEQRNVTHVPLQKLFFLNSSFMVAQAHALASRLKTLQVADDADRVRAAYLLLYGREASENEVQWGVEFLQKHTGGSAADIASWQDYAQVLLSANELSFVE